MATSSHLSGYTFPWKMWVHGLLKQPIWVPLIWTNLNRSSWGFEVFSEGLGVYFWNLNLRMWLIEKQTILISEKHGNFKGWNQDFWLSFSNTPQILGNLGYQEGTNQFFQEPLCFTKNQKDLGNQDLRTRILFISVCSCPTLPTRRNHQPPWRHDISASGITIETSKPRSGLMGCGKTPWLSYQQTGENIPNKMSQILEVFEAVEIFPNDWK